MTDLYSKVDSTLNKVGPDLILQVAKTGPEPFQDLMKKRLLKHQRILDGAWPVLIFGAHTAGQQVLLECLKKSILVSGFLDNKVPATKNTFCSLPILTPNSISSDEYSIVLASGNYSYDIATQLSAMGFKNVITLSEFFLLINSALQPERDFIDDIFDNHQKYLWLYAHLADNISVYQLDNIIKYRLTLNLRYLAQIKINEHSQWFATEFFQPTVNSVFVDGGGYDGDTAQAYLDFCGSSYREIHVFEPDKALAKKASDRLAVYPNIFVHAIGLSDLPQKHYFNSTGITNGRLETIGDVSVNVDSLDRLVTSPISYLKLDVEGFEEQALNGSFEHIINDKPTIALASYHNARDLWFLPEKLRRISPLYDSFFIRHYTQTSFETVIYAKPSL